MTQKISVFIEKLLFLELKVKGVEFGHWVFESVHKIFFAFDCFKELMMGGGVGVNAKQNSGRGI